MLYVGLCLEKYRGEFGVRINLYRGFSLSLGLHLGLSLGLSLVLSACLPKRKVDQGPPPYTVTEANKDLKTRRNLCEASHKEWKDDRCQDLKLNLADHEGDSQGGCAGEPCGKTVVKECSKQMAWDGSQCVSRSSEKNFFRYCSDSLAAQDITLTVAVIKEILNKESCQQAYEALITKKVLFLQNKGISRLEPLRGLVRLESLVLGNNEISNIAVLQSLVNLTYLDLYGNSVSNLTPLAKLAKLKALYLNGNPIDNILPLAELQHLDDLDLSNTPFNAASFPRGAKNCPLKARSQLVASFCRP